MKFYGNPSELINTRKKVNGAFKLIPLFRFNSCGEFETQDIKLIEKLKQHFKFESTESTIKKCKKCNFETDNNGSLMAHYREHKKEDKNNV
jgi:hypothetical protein